MSQRLAKLQAVVLIVSGCAELLRSLLFDGGPMDFHIGLIEGALGFLIADRADLL